MLALIAGRGHLPEAVVASQDHPPLVCALHDMGPDRLPVDIWFRVETLGTLLAEFSARGVTRLCLCGAIDRPQLDPSRIDAATQPLVPRLMQAIGLGDDGALRIVMQIFEDSGIEILAAHEAAPDLLPPKGGLVGDAPLHATLVAGRAGLAQMGARDLGQACLVLDGAVVGTEDETGTAALIARAPSGATLFKGPKPGQDRRADLPVIGPDTVAQADAAGLAAIVLLADGVMVLNSAQTVSAAQQAGISLWVV